MKDFTLQGPGEGEWEEDLINLFHIIIVILAGSAESDDLLDLMDTLS